MAQSPASQVQLESTRHFEERAAKRRLDPAVLQFILIFGVAVRACGATHLTVLDRQLPDPLRGTSLARRARGWIVLEGDEGELITCYRREDAVHFLQRKRQRRRQRRMSRAQRRGTRGGLTEGRSSDTERPMRRDTRRRAR